MTLIGVSAINRFIIIALVAAAASTSTGFASQGKARVAQHGLILHLCSRQTAEAYRNARSHLRLWIGLVMIS
jgi:hypothetical protein